MNKCYVPEKCGLKKINKYQYIIKLNKKKK